MQVNLTGESNRGCRYRKFLRECSYPDIPPINIIRSVKCIPIGWHVYEKKGIFFMPATVPVTVQRNGPFPTVLSELNSTYTLY